MKREITEVRVGVEGLSKGWKEVREWAKRPSGESIINRGTAGAKVQRWACRKARRLWDYIKGAEGMMAQRGPGPHGEAWKPPSVLELLYEWVQSR